MKVTFETKGRRWEHGYCGCDDIKELFMLFIHCDLVMEYAGEVTDEAKTTFFKPTGQVVIRTTIEKE